MMPTSKVLGFQERIEQIEEQPDARNTRNDVIHGDELPSELVASFGE
jgi:hypothetical protein